MSEKENSWKIKNLSIGNFKSIKDISIEPGRVNVFIGKPNSGKSNLLEALVFSSLQMKHGGADSISRNEIRYVDIPSIFYDQNLDEIVRIVNNISGCVVRKTDINFSYSFAGIGKQGYTYDISTDGRITGGSIVDREIPIRKYHFKGIPSTQQDYSSFFLNPDGSNLWSIVKHNSKLKEFASSFFKEYSLEVLFHKQSNKFDIMRRNEDSYYLIDFSMTPDTFQRMLYYLAAIESNKKSILLFEEPEAQSYPPYIQQLADRIVDDTHNQYFITTHSPFIVEKMIERAGVNDDVKIFVTYFQDYQTKVHELSKAEIEEVIGNGVDLFFNMEAYQK